MEGPLATSRGELRKIVPMAHTVFADQTLVLASEPAACSGKAGALIDASTHLRKVAGSGAVGIDVVDESHIVGSFSMRNPAATCDAGEMLSGPSHPGFRLGGRAVDGLRLPRFRDGDQPGLRIGVLPAFGAFTGTCVVDALPDDRLFDGPRDAVHALRRGPPDAVASSAN